MIETILIPDERKAVLIGRKGEVKEELESETRTRIRVRDLESFRSWSSLRSPDKMRLLLPIEIRSSCSVILVNS